MRFAPLVGVLAVIGIVGKTIIRHGNDKLKEYFLPRIIVTHYGGPDALRVVEEECPEPGDGEVRVNVLAAGVSLPDIMAREGVHPETPPVPYTSYNFV